SPPSEAPLGLELPWLVVIGLLVVVVVVALALYSRRK
ncbi:unnamed protein product, partial [marine sediment metagenome]